MLRVVLAGMAGTLVAVMGAFTIGVVGPGSVQGISDNGDGFRIFCGAGLAPADPPGRAAWQNGVVLDFVRTAPCPDPQPSSSAVVLDVAAAGGQPFDLARLAWWYLAALGMVTSAAVWALSWDIGARGTGRLLWWPRLIVLVAPIGASVDRNFLRMFISTFTEPAGLVGTFAFVSGVAVALGTSSTMRLERGVALALMGGGAVFATLARLGNLPVLAVAIVATAVTSCRLVRGHPRTGFLVGPAVAVALSAVAVMWVPSTSAWQDRNYGAVNAYNLVYTMALAELPSGTLDLPPDAVTRAGHGFYPDGPVSPGADRILAAPDAYKQDVWRALISDPRGAASALGVGMQATRGRDLRYLPGDPWTPALVAAAGGGVDGEQGAEPVSFRGWLDGMRWPWWESAVATLGVLVGLVGLVLLARGRRTVATGAAVVAGTAAAGAVEIVAAAVAGDGYFEIAKHVWLAAYLLDVAQWALVMAASGSIYVVLAKARSSTGSANYS